MAILNNFILFIILIITVTTIVESKLLLKSNGKNYEDSKLLVNGTEGEVLKLNSSFSFNLTNNLLKKEDLAFRCRLDYTLVSSLINWNDITLNSSDTSEIKFNVSLKAKRLGGSNLLCSLILKNTSDIVMETKLAEIVVTRTQTVAEIIFRFFVIFFIIILTFVMGCGLEPAIIWGYFKKPLSPFIGFCSQFILMPLISAGLAKFTNIDKAFGLGLLVIGCSPGGGASNVWTILFGGDLNLSMTMTFISTCAALFMMPFWLFVLGRLFIDPKNFKIPYTNIILNLLQLVIPAGLGIIFRWKYENRAKAFMGRVKFMALLFIIFIFTFGTYANLYIYKLFLDYWILLPIGAMLPWLGFAFGLFLAFVTRRSRAQAIAIALETGFQNIGIALLITKYSMPQPDGDLGSTMPIAVSLFTPCPLYVALIIKSIKKRFFSKTDEPEKIKMHTPNSEQHDELLKDSIQN